jgi:hypothetical protein
MRALAILFSILLLSAKPAFPQSKTEIVEVQQSLNLLGYNAGPIDGVWGGKTKSALSLFLTNNNFSSETLINKRTLGLLRVKLSEKPPLSSTVLKGVGVNTVALWSGTNLTVKTKNQFIEHINTLNKNGFDHVTIIACADWIINRKCKKSYQNEKNIVAFARQAVSKTNLHVVLALKAYEQKFIDGRTSSSLHDALQNDAKAREEFVKAWKRISIALADVPAHRLSFLLLNEPEFRFPKPSNSLRKNWESLAISAIQEIRDITPDRVIIYEGIDLSNWTRRNKSGGYKTNNVSDIMRPLPFENIIYSGHPSAPDEFTKQAVYRGYKPGKPFSEKFSRMINKDAKKFINWGKRHNVPLLVGEFGCIGFTDGKNEGPQNPEDCANYASVIYSAYVENNVGVTWWSLENSKTIYKRPASDACPKIKQCPTWVPRNPQLDPNLMKAFRLWN